MRPRCVFLLTDIDGFEQIYATVLGFLHLHFTFATVTYSVLSAERKRIMSSPAFDALPGEHGIHRRDGSLVRKKRAQWGKEKGELFAIGINEFSKKLLRNLNKSWRYLKSIFTHFLRSIFDHSSTHLLPDGRCPPSHPSATRRLGSNFIRLCVLLCIRIRCPHKLSCCLGCPCRLSRSSLPPTTGLPSMQRAHPGLPSGCAIVS